MQSWFSFYASRQNPAYLNHLRTKYQVFIDLVASYIRCSSDDVVEAGCGPGNISRILIERFRRPPLFHLLDNDADILSLTRTNLAAHKNIVIHQHDIRETLEIHKPVSVVFSHGVLEHFPDQCIQRIIDNQLKLSKHHIHYVPSSKYEKPSKGCERLLNQNQWKDICSPDKIIPFNDGLDLILAWGI